VTATATAGRTVSLLALSDERDQWARVCLIRERRAFGRGRTLGRTEGYGQAEADMAAQWNAIARLGLGGPGHTEIEKRRWGPGGREHFADPRPGDFPGRDTDR
jgi:hypothetical protein